jgi:hypothetical protein
MEHRGNRLRHGDVVIEVALRDGIAVVEERRGGTTRRFGAGEWFRLHRGGIALARASRAGELGIESLLAETTLAAMHAARRPSLGARLAHLLRALCPAWGAS